MNAPTPETDPSGLAALVALFVSAMLAALGVATDVATLWVAVTVAAVNLVAFIWTRRKAWAPATVKTAIDTTAREVRSDTRAKVIKEVKALAPPTKTKAPAKKRA